MFKGIRSLQSWKLANPNMVNPNRYFLKRISLGVEYLRKVFHNVPNEHTA